MIQRTTDQKSLLGETLIAENTPITQVTSQFGLIDKTFIALDPQGNGTSTIEDDMFKVDSGIGVNTLASIQNNKLVYVKAGQSGSIVLDAVFSTPVAGTLQGAGIITSENVAAFGYNFDGRFGVFYGYDGHNENQELEITTPAGGAETADIVISGTTYQVNLTAGTTQQNAFEIASQLNGVVPNYFITSNGSTVTFQALVSATEGAYSMTSATAAGTFTQITEGNPLTLDFTPLEEWNVYVPDFISPQSLMDYKVRVDGNISFYIKDLETFEFVQVHQIRESGMPNRPVLENRIIRGGIVVRNLTGAAQPVNIKSSRFAFFINGKNTIAGSPRAESNSGLAFTDSSDETIFIARVRGSFGGKANRVKVFPRTIGLATTSGTRPAVFDVVLNPTFDAPVDFSYVDENESFVEVAKDRVTITGGTIINTFTISRDSQGFFDVFDPNSFFNANETVAIVARIIGGGGSSDLACTFSWLEDVE